MHCLFPRALLACIAEGRSPRQHELATITDKVWLEAFRRGVGSHQSAINVAHVALTGARLDA